MKAQIWRAAAPSVLIAIVRNEIQFDASLYTCCRFYLCLFLERQATTNFRRQLIHFRTALTRQTIKLYILLAACPASR